MNLAGAGLIWGTPLQNAAGAAYANPTPLLLGIMQDAEIESKFDLKVLHGQNQFPDDVFRGKGTISGKVKHARFFGSSLSTLVFGQAESAGITSGVYDTQGATVATTVTPTVPNSGTWSKDLGVISAATGRPFVRVASAPTAGQYSVAAGVYTFAAADVGQIVYINFLYTAISTVAKKGTVQNVPMGYTPTFRLDMYVPYKGQSMVLTLPICVSDGFKMQFKNDDFMVPEFAFQAFADTAGKVMDWATSE
jgi:hypothetical protein